MLYVFQVLAAILIGTALGALLNLRNTVLQIGSGIAIVLGLATIFTGSWVPLAVGVVVFVVVLAMQRGAGPARV